MKWAEIFTSELTLTQHFSVDRTTMITNFCIKAELDLFDNIIHRLEFRYNWKLRHTKNSTGTNTRLLIQC